jgi:hypothetical protein
MHVAEVNTAEDHGQARDMPRTSQSHDGPNTFHHTSNSIPSNIHHGMKGVRRYFPGPRPIQGRIILFPGQCLFHVFHTQSYHYREPNPGRPARSSLVTLMTTLNWACQECQSILE